MASFSGVLHRPLSAAAAVAVAAVTSDFSERFGYSRSSDSSVEKLSAGPVSNSSKEHSSWVSHISVSNIPTRPTASSVQSLTADSRCSVPNSNLFFPPNSLFSSFSSPVASVPVLRTRYQYAKLAKPPKSTEFTSAVPSSSPDVLYRWHLPDPMTCGVSGDSTCGVTKSQTLVVLLGWLGAKQKHLKRYADWYTSRGFNVVTFTFPMAEVVSYKVGGKAEQNVHLLANHLAEWVGEEHGKNLVFHTFSNTGWLTYGAILEKFQRQDPSLMEKIKGCIVDSAPVAAPDPQVWASGFSAALLKKQSVATKGSAETRDSKEGIKPAVTELALLGILEKFFEVVLNLPSVNRRLSGVLDRLSSEQPRCPQLYIYSSSDKVIPAKSVESFIEQQRRAGHEVRACDFVSSPHVDHFRNHPNLYSSQLSTFLEDHVLTCCKDSSP